ncbi:neurofilament heavy polypeptide-like [Patella vulgata]|uniref:neurofilament heavy polypeptide-like n=1 Tax=Patella vulgata TaxID=6465 RepID=UPI00218041B6|nr:neurofilament heavy polypeptide-like [Patella vulgata]
MHIVDTEMSGADRLKTFSTWPLSRPSALSLVRCGFYYTLRNDEVQCCECKQTIKHWARKQHPYIEHYKVNRYCRFVQQFKGVVSSYSPSDNVFSYTSFYADITSRLSSFISYEHHFNQSKEALSNSGFYYVGPGDAVKCFECEKIFKDWDECFVPLCEHHIRSPKCKFIRSLLSETIGGDVDDDGDDDDDSQIPRHSEQNGQLEDSHKGLPNGRSVTRDTPKATPTDIFNRAVTPEYQRKSPRPQSRTPEFRRKNPLPDVRTQESRRRSPLPQTRTPEYRRKSPLPEMSTPAIRKNSSQRESRAPERSRISQNSGTRTPETPRKYPNSATGTRESRRKSPLPVTGTPEYRKKSLRREPLTPERTRKSQYPEARTPESRRKYLISETETVERKPKSPIPGPQTPDSQRHSQLPETRTPGHPRKSPLPETGTPEHTRKNPQLEATKYNVPSSPMTERSNDVVFMGSEKLLVDRKVKGHFTKS